MNNLKTFDQKSMERVAHEATEVMHIADGKINGMIDVKFVSCDFEKRELSLEYPVLEWSLNPAGFMHGGIISTSCDISMAAVAMHFVGGFPPTIQITVDFYKPVPKGESLIIDSKVIKINKNIVYAECIGKLKSSNKVAVCAKGMYSPQIWESALDNI